MPERLRYTEIAPEGVAALRGFGHYLNIATTLDPVLKALIELRVSQINGCEFCTEAHKHELQKHHEPDSRIDSVAVWATSDAFTPREKAAFAWAETLTRLPDGNNASDAEYEAIREFFDGKDLVDLTLAIANINVWNRLGLAFRPQWDPKKASKPKDGEMRDAVDDDGGKVAED
ncbi:carboxymuconolactone decarboxylase family protein [Granulicella cerasi]|uniref:Carboxymuconolactone decarboxylase family protein n=1 Tax=Granulicella cerasi TaxID=741063 RepID=A0ABW1Z3V7_9BACT|nr:carboxymuconolactone decarboxylase family protein [Granulicella cerasi]